MFRLITPAFSMASGARAQFSGFSEDMHIEVAGHVKMSMQCANAVFRGRGALRYSSQKIEADLATAWHYIVDELQTS